MPNIPWPAAISSTFHAGACSTSRRLASNIPLMAASPDMERANSTHISCSGASEPSFGTAEPPRRTASVSRLNPSTTYGEAMKVTAAPR